MSPAPNPVLQSVVDAAAAVESCAGGLGVSAASVVAVAALFALALTPVGRRLSLVGVGSRLARPAPKKMQRSSDPERQTAGDSAVNLAVSGDVLG